MYSRSSRRSSLSSESTPSLDSMSSCSSISSLSSESWPAFEPPSPNGDAEVVRQGKIHIQPVGTFQTWSWHVKWLVLTDTSLTLHTSQNSPQKTVILLRDISVIAHADFKPHCLLLETYYNKRLYLLFKNDEESQGWRYDLSARLPSMGYSTNNVPCTERRELMRDGEVCRHP
ncbi:hypothetical protein DFH09DRAFT_263945 [Mycena vulgaris]|nr:hypothetical protein DFH09DRAFT_263945 [Mycena vulgaris]